MPVLSRACRRLIMAALVLGVTGTAAAQRLDLDSGGSFKGPGPERSVERLLKQHRDNAKAFEPRINAAAGLEAERLRAQARVRELTALLLEAGSGFGEAGSVHVLTGRRLAARLVEIDASIVSADAPAVAAFLSQAPGRTDDIARSVEQLDERMASLFAPLAVMPTMVPDPWPIDRLDPALSSPEALDAALDACARVEGVTKEAIDVLRHAAEGDGTTAQQAAALRQTIVLSCRLLNGMPKWVRPERAQSLVMMFDRASTHVLVPQDAASARADLVRLALLGDVMARIEAARLTPKHAKAVRASLHSLIEAMAPGDNATDDALGALRRGFVLVSEYDGSPWDDGRRIVREVRPLWKHVETRGRGARDELMEALAAVEPRSMALSDPGVLGAMELLRSCLDDARGLCIISEWLAGSTEPAVSARSIWSTAPAAGKADGAAATQRDDRVKRMAGVRLLALGPKLRDDETREEATAEFRSLAAELGAWMPVPGEAELRSAVAAPESPLAVRWRDLTGGTAKPLAEALDAARTDWLTEWAGVKAKPVKGAPEPTPVDPRHVDLMRRAISAAADAATVVEMVRADGSSGIRAWPGFELSGESANRLVQQAQVELTRATGHLINSALDDAEASLDAIEPHAMILGALADLQRRAGELGTRRHPVTAELVYRPAIMPTLGEKLTPGPWMSSAADRESVAVLCRAIEEYAEMNPNADRAAAAGMLKRAAIEAERLRAMLR